MSVVIEGARVEELGECLALIKRSVVALAGTCYTGEEIEAWLDHYPDCAEFAKWGRFRTTFVARDEGRLVGFGQVDLGRREIEGIHVDPDRAGGGIGRRFLTEMEDVVRGAGLKNVQVQASLNAEGFYGACGYAVVERISFRCRNGVSLNALLMQKALAPAG